MQIRYFTFIGLNLAFLFIGLSLFYVSSLPVKEDITNIHPNSQPLLKKNDSYKRTISGIIETSFFSAALSSGLTSEQIFTFTSSIQQNINLMTGIKSGTTFTIILNELDKSIEQLTYTTKNKTTIIQKDKDGRYYTNDGANLSSSKKILPVSGQYAISSHFSTKRKHPVLGVIKPHLGTDYATPVGTPVRTIAKGIILASRYHPIAGNYIVIRHDNNVITRYLHLNDRKVNKGTYVYKGEIIAHSGNTGRTTGPHLHFEYLIKGKAKNFYNLQPNKPI